MTAITMSGVNKAYGDNTVLTGLDLEIQEGEVFALLGPNGAGKTTCVEILEGYRTVDDGEVRVLGLDPARAGAALTAQIGIVLQQTTAFEKSTVGEIVEMFAGLYREPLGVFEAIDKVDLGSARDQLVETLSGGQRRRLDVACGLVGRPALLFLDEPTTGLDPEARRAMWATIEELRRDGVTVLLTTHYLDEAEALADRIGVLIGGRLADVAEPDRVGGREGTEATVSFRAPAAYQPLAGQQVDRGTVSWTTATPGRDIADLVAKIGREPEELIVRRQSLEDAYLQLVGEAIR